MEFPRVGSEIAGYRLESVIARGGMSTVFLGEHLRLARRVAIKVLASELSDDDTFRERFVRESRVAASLDHPNVIPIYEAGELEGLLFIAMRYVQGPNLKTLLHETGPLPPQRLLSIMSQVASALHAAHARGLIHRDVKPGNIMIDPEIGPEHIDQVYLCDFGLTKRNSSHSGITRTGQFVGTIDYMAPEQIEGKDVDGRTDIYSLGCVLYECLTNAVPFEKETEAAVLWAHIQEEPIPVTQRRADLPKAVDGVVRTAMAKRPEDRYQTCAEMLTALRAALPAPPMGEGAGALAPAAETIGSSSEPTAPSLADPVRLPTGTPDEVPGSPPQPARPSDSGLPKRSGKVRRPVATRRSVVLAAVMGLVVGSAATWGGSLLLGPSGGEIYRKVLLEHLPNQASCHQVDPVSPDPSGQLGNGDVFAGASCDPGNTVHVDYYLIHDTAWMQVTFYEILKDKGVTVSDELQNKLTRLSESLGGTAALPTLRSSPGAETCEGAINVATSWSSGPGVFGHSATPAPTSSPMGSTGPTGATGMNAGGVGVLPNGGLVGCWGAGSQKWFVWTDNQTTILSIASGNNNMTTPWWQQCAGPNTEPIAMMQEGNECQAR